MHGYFITQSLIPMLEGKLLKANMYTDENNLIFNGIATLLTDLSRGTSGGRGGGGYVERKFWGVSQEGMKQKR